MVGKQVCFAGTNLPSFEFLFFFKLHEIKVNPINDCPLAGMHLIAVCVYLFGYVSRV